MRYSIASPTPSGATKQSTMTEPSTTTPLTRSLPAGPVSPAYLPTLGLANFGVNLTRLVLRP